MHNHFAQVDPVLGAIQLIINRKNLSLFLSHTHTHTQTYTEWARENERAKSVAIRIKWYPPTCKRGQNAKFSIELPTIRRIKKKRKKTSVQTYEMCAFIILLPYLHRRLKEPCSEFFFSRSDSLAFHTNWIPMQIRVHFVVCCSQCVLVFFHFRVFVPLIGRCWFRRVRHENWKHCTAFSIKPKINNITTRTIHCNTNCAAVVFFRFFVIHFHCRNIYLYTT